MSWIPTSTELYDDICTSCCKTTTIVVLTLTSIILICVLVPVSVHTLDVKTYGVAYSSVDKYLDNQIQEQGIHAGQPGFYFITFSRIYRTIVFDSSASASVDDGIIVDPISCMSADGIQIVIYGNAQYRAVKDNILDIVYQFHDSSNYENQILNRINAAIRHACGDFNAIDFPTLRDQVQQHMLDEINLKIAEIYGESNLFQLTNIDRPADYDAAVLLKQQNQQDILQAQNERGQRLIQANTQLLQAVTNATVINSNALTSAFIIINQAQNDAAAALDRFNIEAQFYLTLINQLNMTTNAFLAYLANRVVEIHSNINVNLPSPVNLTANLPT